MDTKVKICGIKLKEEAAFINEMDVDYVGFVFAKSIRRVDADTAKVLSDIMREDIKRVGVFVDKSVDEINDISKTVGLDIAQVHKNYTEEMIEAIDIPVWYAVSIKDENSISEANEAFQYDNVIGVVTDSHVKGQMGGTGVTFNWEMLSDIEPNVNLILAGGLNQDNIADAIDKVKPNVVDISSGVEHEIDGIKQKSREKIAELLRKVNKNE